MRLARLVLVGHVRLFIAPMAIAPVTAKHLIAGQACDLN
jgi:hypothetical protein